MRHSLWHFLTLTLTPALLLLLSACDNADGPTMITAERPVISDFSVDPSSVQFSEEDGVGDTLVTFRLEAVSELPEGYRLVAEIASIRDRSLLRSDTLQSDQSQPGLYTGSLGITMNTNRFENLIAYIYPVGPNGIAMDRVESTIAVRGIDTGLPEVLEIIHPAAVTIPLPGEPENRFFIAAKVSHTVSIDNISNVRLQLLDSANEQIFASNMQGSNQDYGTVPGDSIYVQDFSINSGNSPASYTVNVHAVDIAGTVSDTLRSTLIISR